MLDLQASRRRSTPSRNRFGLALAGGGPLGAFYEVGTLHAISESFEGIDLTNFDMYVGVSSGAMIAAGLVNGYDTADMGLVFIHNASPEFPVRPGLFLRPAFREYLRRLNAIPGLAADILRQYLRDPGKDWAEAIDPIGRLLPTGLCDNRPFERFLAQMFSGPGRTNDFRELRRSLYIVATELNSGYSVRFGEPGQDHVPISRAIQASTALPGLYPPVAIDGHTFVDGALMRTMNASLLLDEGADFVICINPLVAFDASSAPRRYGDNRKDLDLTRGGLPVVLSQTFRAMIQSRMQVGHRTYKQSYPDSDVLLFEPDRGDDELFFKNVFRYADRKRLAEHAYQRTRRDLYSHADALEPLLVRHGIRLRRDLLSDRSRTFTAAVLERGRRMQPVTGSLHRTLDRLENALHTRA
ncbi:MAG: patatin-like phospholipase family protein [Steroidobacteraceae bacterium]|nr:patatin-like phospholipase family protein [Steroidobacteraceae bacterium]